MATTHEKRIIDLAEKLVASNSTSDGSPSSDVINLLCELEEAVELNKKRWASPKVFTDRLRIMLAEHDKEQPTSNGAIAYGCTMLAIEYLNRYPSLSDEQKLAFDKLADALQALS